jgi:hypothetical protein
LNSHLSPSFNETAQGRNKRAKQAEQIVKQTGCNWDFAVMGIDLNDIPKSLDFLNNKS